MQLYLVLLFLPSFANLKPPSLTLSAGVYAAFLIREPASLLCAPTQTFKSFKMSSITLKLFSSNLTVFNVYRPPPATTKTREPVPFSDFVTALYTFLSLAATTPHEFHITGDFNLHLDDPTNSDVQQFLVALKFDSTDLTQHVSFPTHRENYTLDLVITANTSSLSPVIYYSPVSPSDHFPIFSTLTISPLSSPPLTEFSFHCLKSISLSKFTRDIHTSQLITHSPTHLSDLVDSYNSILSPPFLTNMRHSKLKLFVLFAA